MNTSERILQLEKELTDLRAQERAEKEEARKRAAADKDKELTAIKNAIAAFNEKHDETFCLGIATGKDLFETFYPWL